MKNTVIRDNSRIENVDFTKLNKILNKKGIRRAELSRRCGYCSTYVKDIVFRQKKLNWTVANMLERVYGISLDEYCCEKTDNNNDTTETTANGEFLKMLELASKNEHMSIENFSFDCILKGLEFLKRLELASKNEHMSIENFIFDCILKGLEQEEKR